MRREESEKQADLTPPFLGTHLRPHQLHHLPAVVAEHLLQVQPDGGRGGKTQVKNQNKQKKRGRRPLKVFPSNRPSRHTTLPTVLMLKQRHEADVGGSAGTSPGSAENTDVTQVAEEPARVPVILQLRRTKTGWWKRDWLIYLCSRFSLIAHKVKQTQRRHM